VPISDGGVRITSMDGLRTWNFKEFIAIPIAAAILAAIAMLTQGPLGAGIIVAVMGVSYMIASSPAAIGLRRRRAQRRESH
jgi:hypothetical protein